MTKDDDRLKPPPGLVEGLKKLTPPWLERLARQRVGRPLPQSVFQDVLDWLVAHERDGDPQAVRRVHVWLDKEHLTPSQMAELLRLRAAAAPEPVPEPEPEPESKGYDAPKRNVLCSIMRELSGPDGPPDGMSTYELMKQIKPLWAKAWDQIYPERKAPRMPGKGTVAAARAALKNLPKNRPR